MLIKKSVDAVIPTLVISLEPLFSSASGLWNGSPAAMTTDLPHLRNEHFDGKCEMLA